MDIALLMHDPTNNKVIVASADRTVYFVKDGELHTIAPDKVSIGSTLPKLFPYVQTEVDADSPLQFFLFSDGIVDQFGGARIEKVYDEAIEATRS